jgi:molecular chaperone HscA
MQHAAEDMTRRILTEARVEARRVIAAVTAAINADGDLLPLDERMRITDALAACEAAIAGDDRDAITTAVEKLEEATRAFAERRMDRAIGVALKGRDVDSIERSSGARRGA